MKRVKISNNEICRLSEDLPEAKFRYSEATRYWVLASLNKKWRDYKSELRCEYFSEDKSIQELINNVPLGVMRDQWTSLVARWCTDESKEAVRRKFDELSQNSESDASKLIDQAFLSAMGPEYNGRVKGLGMGSTLRAYYGLKQIDSLATTGSSGSRGRKAKRGIGTYE